MDSVGSKSKPCTKFFRLHVITLKLDGSTVFVEDNFTSLHLEANGSTYWDSSEKKLTHLVDAFEIEEMSLKLPRGFSLFSSGSSNDEKKGDLSNKRDFSPSLKLVTDKEIYRPADSVLATIEICSRGNSDHDLPSLLVENLGFEIKGIEKLDTQWFFMQKPSPGSKQRRGERLFLDCSAPSIVSKVILSTRSTRTYNVRVKLPNILPPSYRGTTIRYIYYVRATLHGRWLVLENGHHSRSSKDDFIQLEARTPLQIWVTQKNINLLNEGFPFASYKHGKKEGYRQRVSCLNLYQSTEYKCGTLPVESAQVDIYWKEKDADCEWIRANENSDALEDEYDSSRDDVSSVSSYNPNRGSTDMHLRNSLSMQSLITKVSNSEAQRSGFPYIPLSQLSVAEIVDDPGGDFALSPKKLNHFSSASSTTLHRKISGSSYTDKVAPSVHGPGESNSSEGFIRGRSYNIRIDDQVLLRFSPSNSDSSYYFGDMIGGTLTFFHGEGARRCLEVSVTLETSEIINQHFAHPSRRSSLTLTKVQSDHHEVVADLVQTSFLFSIPIDGPMSFSTPYINVQWALRFEFFTTAKHVDLTRYEHPLLIGEREKGDWVLPITVYAPPPRSQVSGAKSENLSLGSPWVRT